MIIGIWITNIKRSIKIGIGMNISSALLNILSDISISIRNISLYLSMIICIRKEGFDYEGYI